MSQNPGLYPFLLFDQGQGLTQTVDLTKAAQSQPRLVTDYLGYSFHAVWTGTPKAKVVVQFSNAAVSQGKLIGSPDWIAVPGLALDIGGADEPSPGLLDVSSGRVTWVSLLITPNAAGQNPGTATFRFGGTRRAQ